MYLRFLVRNNSQIYQSSDYRNYILLFYSSESTYLSQFSHVLRFLARNDSQIYQSSDYRNYILLFYSSESTYHSSVMYLRFVSA